MPLPHEPASEPHPSHRNDAPQCASCRQTWPCEVARYQAELRELREELAELRTQPEGWKD